MRHAIDLTQGPAAAPEMAQAIANCVHCGFCLPACPTYRVLGEELDSPRGRIFLMKESLEGAFPTPDVMPYIDKCLGCMACVTACPSGVEYGALLSPFRAMAETAGDAERGFWHRIRRAAALQVLPHPRRLRAALTLAHWTRPLHGLLPPALKPLTQLMPPSLPKAQPLPPRISPSGDAVARVALVTGCAQTVLAPDINHATVRVLQAYGIEVAMPAGQACCGALDMHAGQEARARARALGLCAALPADVEAVLTNAAGCGSGIHEYPLLFKDRPQLETVQRVAHMAQDASVFLSRLPEAPALRLRAPLRVAYHDACHLQHAQRVTAEPRLLLQNVEGLDLVELGDAGFCCGSAGIYNIDQPDIAAELGQLKAQAALDTGADVLVTGNIGCMVQLQTHLHRLGSAMPVRHTMQILASALSSSQEAP